MSQDAAVRAVWNTSRQGSEVTSHPGFHQPVYWLHICTLSVKCQKGMKLAGGTINALWKHGLKSCVLFSAHTNTHEARTRAEMMQSRFGNLPEMNLSQLCFQLPLQQLLLSFSRWHAFNEKLQELQWYT